MDTRQKTIQTEGFQPKVYDNNILSKITEAIQEKIKQKMGDTSPEADSLKFEKEEPSVENEFDIPEDAIPLEKVTMSPRAAAFYGEAKRSATADQAESKPGHSKASHSKASQSKGSSKHPIEVISNPSNPEA